MPISSEQFLKKIGAKYWSDFEKISYADPVFLDVFSEESRPEFYENADTPCSVRGRRILCRAGYVQGKLYIQFLGYRLSEKLLMVAATYKTDPEHSNREECDVYFFRRKCDKLEPVDLSNDTVKFCLKQWNERIFPTLAA